MADKRKKKTRGDRIAAAGGPLAPPPGPQGPGFEEQKLGMDSDLFWGLDGEGPEEEYRAVSVYGIDEGLEAAWYALSRAVPELRSFFEPALMDRFESGTLERVMNVYGRFRRAGETPAMGDLAYLGKRGSRAGRFWALVVTGGGSAGGVSEGMTLGGEDPYDRKFKVLELDGFEVLKAWQPTARKVLDPYSQVGKFWGTNLSAWGDPLTYYPGSYAFRDALDAIFHHTAYGSSSLEALINQLEPEMHVLG